MTSPTRMDPRPARLIATILGALAGALAASAAAPVEFLFVPPVTELNPFAREIWAKVTAPSGRVLTVPAFYADSGLFCVRVRPEEQGTYHIGPVSETTLGERKTDLVVSLAGPGQVDVTARTRLPSVLRSPDQPRMFLRSDGRPYLPVGCNLAWAPDGSPDTVTYYESAFPTFARANLNWMRIWMAHWDGLNLDWLPAGMGPSPRPGELSEDVARRWDRIVALAEDNGVYIQIVLQHHGQYNTHNNSNWAGNPWNAANPGGFLKSPQDFFTDPKARLITLLKYRYIVARWGWSPAVLAWELFNEVHWTDSMRDGHEADVARWHSEMAQFIRSVDVYAHLITTSTENLKSPVYEKMDYYQPHLYAANMVAGARAFSTEYRSLDKPAFYGEEGDDHVTLPPGAVERGLGIVPPVWASVMGQGDMAAQPWTGWDVLSGGRADEVGAVFRFLALSGAGAQRDLEPFSAVVECARTVPLEIRAGEYWQRRAPLEAQWPLDGTEPMQAAEVAATLVGSKASVADGFPDRATYHFDLPAPTTMRVRIGSVGQPGGSLRVSVDGAEVASRRWAAADGDPKPDSLGFPVPGGRHTLLLEGTGPEWVGITSIDTGLKEPVLGLIGRRSARFIEAWIWNREGLYAVNPSPAAAGTAVIPDVPAGTWKVTWWDAVKGVPFEPAVVSHPGGALRLPTPPVTRYSAVSLALKK